MIVKDLRKLLQGVPDDLEVLIPVNAEFDGLFRSPCVGENGVSQISVSEDGHDDDEYDMEQKDVFMILPHGFSEEQEGPSPELN